MDSTSIVNLSPLLDYGFAGFALIQFCAGVWICVKGLGVLASVRDVVALNTATLAELDRALTASGGILQGVKEELIRRPCQMPPEQLRELVRRLQPASGA